LVDGGTKQPEAAGAVLFSPASGQASYLGLIKRMHSGRRLVDRRRQRGYRDIDEKTHRLVGPNSATSNYRNDLRSYADFCVSSSSAKLHLEAVSLQQPGFPDETFRYRLVETKSKHVLWERWQTHGEGSPVNAFVSDEGYVVVRAHWLDWASENLLFIDPKGKKELVITVAAEGHLDELPPAAKPEKRRDRQKPATFVWTDSHIRVSTAGPLWTDGSFGPLPPPTSACGPAGAGGSSSIWRA
jgi:hypothetical protein